MYETMALHIYQDATAGGHRYQDIGDPRPWPMGNDNTMSNHIASDSISPGERSNNMLATKYVDLWFERGYVPDGDILSRIGVDTSSNSRATVEQWDKFDQLNDQLQNRPSYKTYQPVIIYEKVPADFV